MYVGLDKQYFERKLYIFLYPSAITYVLGTQKNRLIKTVPLSTHNTCFGFRNKKTFLLRTLNYWLIIVKVK